MNRKLKWLLFPACMAIINGGALFIFSKSVYTDIDAKDAHQNDVVTTRHQVLEDNGNNTKRAFEDNTIQTGSFANCQQRVVTAGSPHPDQKNITLSCHTFPYRMPSINASEEILIGVLSGAGGNGLRRRASIRDTWARGHSVFFIVAGPWEDIKSEYEDFQDLIWLDQEEIYDGEKSVLTFKTMTFVKVAHDLSSKQNLDIKYAFKTDDDSFVNVKYLHEYLLHTERKKELDYWGCCTGKNYKASRNPKYKWSISKDVYPEEFYPKYCQGAGFALSRTFLDCAAGPDEHLAKIRFMPFEDAAVGLLAERCDMEPISDKCKLIQQYRTPLKEEHRRIKLNLPKIDKEKLTIPKMEQIIVQHRIHDEWDMNEHFKQVSNPNLYQKQSKTKWYTPKHDETSR